MLQSNYTPTKPGIIPAANTTNGDVNMKQSENIDILNFLDSLMLERKEHPEYYLLTSRESEFLSKAAACFEEAKAAYINPLDSQTLSKNVIQAITTQTLDLLHEKNISTEKLQTLIDKKFRNTFYWTAAAELIRKEDRNGLLADAGTCRIVVLTSDSDEKTYFQINEPNNKFLKAETMQKRLSTLGLSDLYLYVSKHELNTLEYFGFILDFADSPATIDTSKFYAILSTRTMNAFSSIGAASKKPQMRKTLDSKGRKTTDTIYETNYGDIVLFDFTPYTDNGIITAGDPNTSKLLFFAQMLTAETGKQELEIPLTDYMKFRNWSQRKEAAQKATEACIIARHCGLDVFDETPDGQSYSGINYFQYCKYEPGTKGGRKGGSIKLLWSTPIYEHIIYYSSQGKQIEQIDKNIFLIQDDQPNPFNIAIAFSHTLRGNAGSKRDHRLSVKTLLDRCMLPLYRETSDIISDDDKPNYINYPSEAPRRIIKPFIAALDYLTQKHPKHDEILRSYRFMHKNGKELTAEELERVKKDYKFFITLNVDVIFVNEPNYKPLIKAKAKHQNKETESKPKQKSKTKHAAADPVEDESNQAAEPNLQPLDYFEGL